MTFEMTDKHLSLFLAVLFALVAVIIDPQRATAQSSDGNILSRDAVLRDPELPAFGNPKGDITIVEYFDYQCPYCRKVHSELLKAVREDGRVRLVFKDWPIFGGVSVYAAKLALAAKYQNKYGEAQEALITVKEKLTEAKVQQALAQAGIDLARAMQDLEKHQDTIDALLARHHAQAVALGFEGTPAFIVGTFRVFGALDAATFKRAIHDARAAQKR